MLNGVDEPESKRRSSVGIRTWLLIGSVAAYVVACLLPCYDVALSDNSSPVTGWFCLTQCYWFGLRNWFPNPILFTAVILVWRRRSSAKYWGLAALFGSASGISPGFIWTGAAWWIVSMSLVVAAGFVLAPDTRPIVPWLSLVAQRVRRTVCNDLWRRHSA
jgi:hypothetical protein